MIDHALTEHEALRALVAAGKEGVPLGAAMPLSVAIRLGMNGHAVITGGDRQRAIVTQQGAAFARRQVWA